MSQKSLLIGLAGILIIGGGAFFALSERNAPMSYKNEEVSPEPLPPVVPSAGVTVTAPASGATARPRRRRPESGQRAKKGSLSLAAVSTR